MTYSRQQYFEASFVVQLAFQDMSYQTAQFQNEPRSTQSLSRSRLNQGNVTGRQEQRGSTEQKNASRALSTSAQQLVIIAGSKKSNAIEQNEDFFSRRDNEQRDEFRQNQYRSSQFQQSISVYYDDSSQYYSPQYAASLYGPSSAYYEAEVVQSEVYSEISQRETYESRDDEANEKSQQRDEQTKKDQSKKTQTFHAHSKIDAKTTEKIVQLISRKS